jgi:hypothetical protein
MVAGLFDAAMGKKAKASMKVLVAGLGFLDQVSQDPMPEAVKGVVILKNVLGKVASLEAGVI